MGDNKALPFPTDIVFQEDRFWERFVKRSSHMYPWKVHQEWYHI